ncbi:MAG: hypothetical protein QXT45_05415 [Candidatus Bilamarchaeaceae archaeon]
MKANNNVIQFPRKMTAEQAVRGILNNCDSTLSYRGDRPLSLIIVEMVLKNKSIDYIFEIGLLLKIKFNQLPKEVVCIQSFLDSRIPKNPQEAAKIERLVNEFYASKSTYKIIRSIYDALQKFKAEMGQTAFEQVIKKHYSARRAG